MWSDLAGHVVESCSIFLGGKEKSDATSLSNNKRFVKLIIAFHTIKYFTATRMIKVYLLTFMVSN